MSFTAELLPSKTYIENATRDIAKATSRITLVVVMACYDETTAGLFDAVCAAAGRGIQVTVAIDTFTYAELGGHFRFTSQFSKKVRPISELKKRLAQSGVKITWLGNYGLSLLSGRTHTKWLVVDDIVYSFGGVNLCRMGIESVDYMLKVRDIGLASRLVAEQQRIVKADRGNHGYRSHSFGDISHTVLVDGGFVGDSIIYRRACALAKLSKKVTYVSQYCPGGKLHRLLAKTNSALYFNPWNKADSLNAALLKVSTWLTHNKTLYTRNKYLHAKFMIFELVDGSKVALSGSHNFANGGVWLGTREVALETTDPKIISGLERFFKQHVA